MVDLENFPPRSFHIRMHDDCMRNDDLPMSFAEGDIVVLDPERSAEHGSFVLVRFDEKVTRFGVLLEVDRRRYLALLNPELKHATVEVPDDAEYLGTAFLKAREILTPNERGLT